MIFLIVAAGLVAGAKKLIHTRKHEIAQMKPPAERPEAVETAVIRKGEMPLSRHFLSVIEPVKVADIAFRALGYLETVEPFPRHQPSEGFRAFYSEGRFRPGYGG